MDEQVKKLRDEIRPKDLHFQCGDTVCAAHGSWEKGFDAAYDLQAKRIAELESKEAALLKSFQDQVNAGADFYLATVKRLEKEKAELVAKRAQELKERDALKARVAELEASHVEAINKLLHECKQEYSLDQMKNDVKSEIKESYSRNLQGLDTDDEDKLLNGMQQFARDVENICSVREAKAAQEGTCDVTKE